jgi:photosystem II stability/assembly factor-like uncharacterized protein
MKNIFILKAAFLLLLLTNLKIYAQPGWVSQDIGTNDFVAISFINQNTGYIFCIDGWIYKTTNKGQNWIQSMKYNYQGISNPVVQGVAITDSIFMVISGQAYWGGGIYITQNCHTWFYSGITPPFSGISIFRRLCPTNNTTVFACGAQASFSVNNSVENVVYKTTNTGTNWMESLRAMGVILNDIKFKNNYTGFTIGDGEILVTTNSGANWTIRNSVMQYMSRLSQINNDTFYITHQSGKMTFTPDAGLTVVPKQTQSNDTLRGMYFLNGKTGWIVGDSGYILKTSNAGINFNKQASNTTYDLLDIHFIDLNTGIICGKNGKILRTTNGGITGIENEVEENPLKYELSQNYPNPFNPVTKIRFSISKTENKKQLNNIKLVIYDISGKEVETLVNEQLNYGTYSVSWNATAFSSGIYFYSLSAGNYRETKRMVLIK